MPLSSEKHIIDKKFREGLEHYKAQPSGKVWQRISGSLSTEEKRGDNKQRLLVLTLLLLFLGTGTIVMTTGNRTGKNEVEKSKTEKQVIPGAESNATSLSHPDKDTRTAASLKSDNTVQSAVAGTKQELNWLEKHLNFLRSAVVSEPRHSTAVKESPFADWQISSIDYLPNKSSHLSNNGTAKKKNGNFKHAPPSKIYTNPKFYKADVTGAYFGFGQTLNNTWVVDRKAIASENLKYQPTFGVAVMLHCGYNITNKWGVEGSWIINSLEGQKYKYLPSYSRTTTLEYYQKHISFSYMQVPLMMRYKVQGWSGVTQTPIFVNYSLGVQYGRLMSYGIDQSKEKPTENDLYRRNEYAIVAGIDYDFITHNPMFFTVGVRTSFGSNLFKANAPDDLEFSDPHNVLVGIHGALNFSLKRAPAKPEQR